MKPKNLTRQEQFYWLVRKVFGAASLPFTRVANWATDRLNKSYYADITKSQEETR